MTLSAWIRPESQSGGERSCLARPMRTSSWPVAAYRRLGALDNVLAALLVGATIWFCLTLGCGTARGVSGRRRAWWRPVALFLAGSLVDAALAPSGRWSAQSSWQRGSP